MEKLKILHVIDSLSVGGREKVVINLCNRYDPNKADIYLLTLTDSDNSLNVFVNKSVHVFQLPLHLKRSNGFRGILYAPKAIFWLIFFIRKISPTIIHSHLFNFKLLILSISIFFSRRRLIHVRTIHTSGLFYEKGGALNILRRSVEYFSMFLNWTCVISISEDGYKKVQKLFSSCLKMHVKIANGIDVDSFMDKPLLLKEQVNQSRRRVVYVARLDKGKNHITVLKAWREIEKKYPDAELLFVGDGDERKHLEALCIDYELKSVVFYGTVSDVTSILLCSYAAVFPSEFEGFPGALVEKMASGLPVIASDIAVNREILETWHNGIIVPVFDHNAYLEALKMLFENPDIGCRIGKNAIERAKDFSWDKIEGHISDFYMRCIKKYN